MKNPNSIRSLGCGDVNHSLVPSDPYYETIFVVIIHVTQTASLLIQTQDVDNRRCTKGLKATVPLAIGLSYANKRNVLGLLAW